VDCPPKVGSRLVVLGEPREEEGAVREYLATLHKEGWFNL